MSKRHLTVRLNLRGRDLASFLDEAHRTIESKATYDPSRIELAWAGSSRTSSARRRDCC